MLKGGIKSPQNVTPTPPLYVDSASEHVPTQRGEAVDEDEEEGEEDHDGVWDKRAPAGKACG